jgi:hypothetical protein
MDRAYIYNKEMTCEQERRIQVIPSKHSITSVEIAEELTCYLITLYFQIML